MESKKTEMANCKYCQEEFKRNPNKKPIQIYCCTNHTTLANKKVNYNYNKRQEVYEKNKLKIRENRFVQIHKKKFVEILGDKCCLCQNKERTHYHHLTYENLPRDNVNAYAKFLMPLCSTHHQNFHIIMEKYGGIQ